MTAEQALGLCSERALVRGSEEAPVELAVGRVLAADARAQVDHPPFRASALDGFAVRSADTPAELTILGESRAGIPFTDRVTTGAAVTISTGAIVPDGADAVVPLERAERDGARVRVPAAVPAGAAVRPPGEDLRAEDVVMPAGARVRAHQVAALAASGNASVLVRVRPRVAILITGEEVVPAGAQRTAGQIFDASGPGITAQARAAGADVVAREHVGDDPEETQAMLARLLSDDVAADLIVTVGGASVGGHDHVPASFAAEGMAEVFWGVEVRPGHPLWLGTRDGQAALALPGNPVSAAVCFHAFGRPLLGIAESWSATGPLATPFTPGSNRTELARCAWRGSALEPLPRQASHAVTSLAGADALVWIPGGGRTVPDGTQVRYAPLAG